MDVRNRFKNIVHLTNNSDSLFDNFLHLFTSLALQFKPKIERPVG